MSVFKDLQTKFNSASIIQQLIYINVVIFIITLISSSFSGLYAKQMSFVYEWFSLSSSFDISLQNLGHLLAMDFYIVVLYTYFLIVLFCIILADFF